MPTAPGAGWDVPTLAVAIAMLVLFATAHLSLRWWVRRQARRRPAPVRAETSWDDFVLPLASKAIRWTLPLLALILGSPALSGSPALAEVVGNATSLLLIGVGAFILFQVVEAAATLLLKPHRLDVRDNLRARAIQTQVLVLKKVFMTAIGIFTLVSMLMVFDSVRQFGASILASAGIAGFVVGFAAQRSIATLLAGVQIALKVNALQVTDAKEHTLELRALASTANASQAWDLRCEVREKLIAFVRQNYPASLPQVRTSFVASSSPPLAAMAPADEVFT